MDAESLEVFENFNLQRRLLELERNNGMSPEEYDRHYLEIVDDRRDRLTEILINGKNKAAD